MSTGSQKSLFSNLKRNLRKIREGGHRGVCLTIFSDVRRFHSLACTCRKLHLFNKKLWMHLDGIDHNCPHGLHSPKSNKTKNTDILLKRCNSQWITVGKL